jgi:hypothetical protein
VQRRLPLGGSWLALAAGAAFVPPGLAQAEPPTRDVQSVFHVAKSENRNQVHYGIRLDAACDPAGPEPVYAYWRMLERGPGATEPLLSREVGAYGLAEQRVVRRGVGVGQVVLRLRALPSRLITVATTLRDGRCEAVASTVIGGTSASLDGVFAQLRWPFGVAYLELSGRALADGRELRERVSE